MKDIDDITSALASQYGGDMLGLEAEKKEADRKERERRAADERPTYQPASSDGAPRIWPSERMELRSTGPMANTPKRPPVLIATYTDDDLEWMFSTPVKREWEFKVWLEVIGLPPDLHEKLDGAMYSYAARAFLAGKKKAHQS